MELAIILDTYDGTKEIIEKYKDKPNILFELRIDKDAQLLLHLENENLDPQQAILTLRSENEGGSYPESENRKITILNFIELAPKYIDFEFANDRELLEQKIDTLDSVPILSRHNYQQPMYDGGIEFNDALQATPLVDRKDKFILKFVGNPIDSLDTIRTINMLSKIYPHTVILGVGSQGDLSRVLGKHYQQEFVFASVNNENLLSLNTLYPIFSNRSNLLTGLIGRSLTHSLSPIIHGVLREQSTRSGYYHTLEVQKDGDLKDLLDYLLDAGFQGVNVTIPYKTTILRKMDLLSSQVTLVNATNTILFNNGKTCAENTDITGFSTFLKAHQLDRMSTAVVFGAGGASRAIAAALLQSSIEVTILNRTEERINEFPESLRDQIHYYSGGHDISKSKFDLLINATPVGSDGIDPSKKFGFPRDVKAVIDLLYTSENTELMKTGNQFGIPSYSGKEMLFHQAVDAFELWTHHTIDRGQAYNRFQGLL
ncbi:MAG: type I 3-dehydroquinate dehydratase [Candidatus Kariarchaeaceae archaeon]|jgi:shikimate dehydrogenase